MAEPLDEVPADLAPYQPQMRYLLEGAQLPDRNLAALMLRLAVHRLISSSIFVLMVIS